MYTAVFTVRMHGRSSRVHGLVHGRVHVYTTLIRATHKAVYGPCTRAVCMCTSPVHGCGHYRVSVEYTAVYTAVHTAVYIAVYTTVLRRVHGHVRVVQPVAVYTTVRTRPYARPSTGRVHGPCACVHLPYTAVDTTVYGRVHGCEHGRVHGGVHSRVHAVYIAVCSTIHGRVHSHVRKMYTCKQPCTRLLTRGTWPRTRSCTRVHGRVYGPCTRCVHGLYRPCTAMYDLYTGAYTIVYTGRKDRRL